MKTLLFYLLLAMSWPAAAISVVDDEGIRIEFAEPAHRIVSLAPHATELLFAAGAGDRIIGTAEYSDYPPAARAIPRIGSALYIDLERIIGLKPDLVVAWRSGNLREPVERLRTLGIPVYITEPRHLESIPSHLVRLGKLAGTEKVATAAADDFSKRLAVLRSSGTRTVQLRVFYQISLAPLYTVNGDHLISEIIGLCGGVNIFAPLRVFAPVVSLEAVLQAAPEVILAADTGRGVQAAVHAYWSAWPALPAVAGGNLYFIDADVISRATPRILSGAEAICRALDTARAKR
jgi:iron complex transport system substrate-binding protein